MASSRQGFLFLTSVLFCAVLCSMPALASDGKISIAYRGSGGYYVGDTIVFDGLNTAGNVTVLAISGPGLSAQGVPLYNLNGTPGTGNTAKAGSTGLWVFPWDMSRADTSLLQTARYTITAWDSAHPEIVATTSVFLKKPEFYLTITPATCWKDDYIEIEGMAEKDVSSLRLDVTDGEGTVLHTYYTPVSALGFFQHGFRIDMEPGRYFVTGSNPAMEQELVASLTVVEPETTATATATGTTGPGATVTSAGTTGQEPVSTRAGNGVMALALPLSGALVALVLFGRK